MIEHRGENENRPPTDFFRFCDFFAQEITDVLLMTDDDLLRKASRNKATLDVRVENPVKWLIEAMEA